MTSKSEPTEAGQPRSARKRLFLLFKLAVSFGLLGYLLWGMDLGQLARLLVDVRINLLVAALAVMFFERWYSGYKWCVLVRLWDPQVPMWPLIRLFYVANYLSLFLPGGASEAVRFAGLARSTKNPAMAFSSILVDRGLGVVMLLAACVLGSLLVPIELDDWIFRWAAIGFGTGLVGLVMLVHPTTLRVGRWALPQRVFGSLMDKAGKVIHYLRGISKRPWILLWLVLLSIGTQVLRILVVYAIAMALSIDLPLVYFVAFVPIIVFLKLLPISIGGLGVREASFVYLFGLAHVVEETALTLSLLLYVLMVVSMVPAVFMVGSVMGSVRWTGAAELSGNRERAE